MDGIPVIRGTNFKEPVTVVKLLACIVDRTIICFTQIFPWVGYLLVMVLFMFIVLGMQVRSIIIIINFL